MPSFTKTVAIRRSPEQVFAVLDDLENAKQWMPSIRRIDVLTPGMSMGVGFKWRETRRVLGILRVKVVLVITSYDPPRTWGLTFNDGKLQATATFELSSIPSGTQVTFVEDVEDLQGKAKRAERMARMMAKQDGDLLDRLKVRVESTSEEPAGLAPDPDPVAAPAAPSKPGKAARPAAKKGKASKPKPAKSSKSAKPAKKATKKR